MLTLLLCIGYRTQAQIPNGGFETWTSNDPDGWVTTNGLMLLGNPQSVFKSTDAHSGSFACEVNTVNIINKPPGVFVPDYTGSVFTGKQVFVTSYFGFPYSNKPALLRFWYKYNARHNDTASVLAYTTKWNTTLQKRDTLSIAIGMLKDSVGVYTKGEVMFFMMDSVNTPDSAVVLFASSMITANASGAKLLLDDLEFAGGNVGVEEQNALRFKLYPNPATNGFVRVELQQPVSSAEITVFDVQGRKVLAQPTAVLNGNITFPTVSFEPGLYLLSVQTVHGSGISRLIIE